MNDSLYEKEPILQIIAWNCTVSENTETYILSLSDGSYYRQCILSQKLNYLINEDRLLKYTIIQVKEHTTVIKTNGNGERYDYFK